MPKKAETSSNIYITVIEYFLGGLVIFAIAFAIFAIYTTFFADSTDLNYAKTLSAELNHAIQIMERHGLDELKMIIAIPRYHNNLLDTTSKFGEKYENYICTRRCNRASLGVFSLKHCVETHKDVLFFGPTLNNKRYTRADAVINHCKQKIVKYELIVSKNTDFPHHDFKYVARLGNIVR